ncbi:MAG: TetR/AcrR family transcriptional regulator [Lachnospiraceae bacterium]|nr:TetR/AcrR family transcriptional regulator [Lachnospiraceae bacterium]
MAQNKEATKDCIFTALILLMEQKEYKYITVTDIARKAGVSRMTYYRTYSSKEDILIQHFRKTAQAMIPEEKQDIESALCSFFAWFQKNRGLTKLLEDASLMGLLVDCFSVFTDYLYRTLHPEAAEISGQDYAAHFQRGGLFSILTHHLGSGAAESPEEMAAITQKIMM